MDKKSIRSAPQRKRRPKKKKPAKTSLLSKKLEGLSKMKLTGQGPIGASGADSPFESKLSELAPSADLDRSVKWLDADFVPSKKGRQALQEIIFHKVGCGEALSRTVFWVIGMGMTTLLTIWIFQVSDAGVQIRGIVKRLRFKYKYHRHSFTN